MSAAAEGVVVCGMSWWWCEGRKARSGLRPGAEGGQRRRDETRRNESQAAVKGDEGRRSRRVGVRAKELSRRNGVARSTGRLSIVAWLVGWVRPKSYS
jgi:hypothetical protein